MPFPEILTQARFYLELNLEGSVDTIDGYFLECGGFSRSQAVIEVSEVTPQVWGAQGRSRGHIVQSKIPGNSTYTNLTLKRGLTLSSVFWDWLEVVGAGGWFDKRRDGSLVIYNQAAEEQVRLEFTGAWPVSYKISDMSVTSAEYNIEEIEIAVESLKRV
ncbi:MAG: phage tail protein [Cyanobacteria bacterium P01_D01_bin.36]